MNHGHQSIISIQLVLVVDAVTTGMRGHNFETCLRKFVILKFKIFTKHMRIGFFIASGDIADIKIWQVSQRPFTIIVMRNGIIYSGVIVRDFIVVLQ